MFITTVPGQLLVRLGKLCYKQTLGSAMGDEDVEMGGMSKQGNPKNQWLPLGFSSKPIQKGTNSKKDSHCLRKE